MHLILRLGVLGDGHLQFVILDRAGDRTIMRALFPLRPKIRADSADLGPQWKQSAHYGPIAGSIENHELKMTITKDAKAENEVHWTSANLQITDAAVIG